MGNICKKNTAVTPIEIETNIDDALSDMIIVKEKFCLIKNERALDNKISGIRKFINAISMDQTENEEAREMQTKFKDILVELLEVIDKNKNAIISVRVDIPEYVIIYILDYHKIDMDIALEQRRSLTRESKDKFLSLIEQKRKIGRELFVVIKDSMIKDENMLKYIELVIRINILSWCYVFKLRCEVSLT